MNRRDPIRPFPRKAVEPVRSGRSTAMADLVTETPAAADAIDRMAKSFLASVDLSRLGRIRYRGSHEVISPARNKYVDRFPHWVWRNAQRIHEAGLDRHPRRILELGSGGCIFAAMCQRLGHEMVATDKDHADAIFRELSDLLGIAPGLLKVEPFQPLSTNKWGRFDVVAAFALCFNTNCGRLWGQREWEFFFDDLRRNVLAENGRVILKFSHEHQLWPAIDGQFHGRFWRQIHVNGRTVRLQG